METHSEGDGMSGRKRRAGRGSDGARDPQEEALARSRGLGWGLAELLAGGWYDEEEDWRNHPLFRAKGRGQVRECRGRVHLRAVFVDDDESVWEEESRELYRYMLGAVGEILEANGPEGLVVTFSTENRTFHGVADGEGDDGDAWVPLLMGAADEAGVEAVQRKYKKLHGYDESPLVFVFDKDFRSSARQSRRGVGWCRGEWATISTEGTLEEDPDEALRTLLHEVLHLFGAADFYYPPVVKRAAKRWFPESIMLADGDEIDDATRVLIGWDAVPSPSARAFFEATRGVTVAEIERAMYRE